MSDIGIRLNTDRLVLTRGRDFTWTFDNLDDSRPPQPIDYPDGELYFELDTGGQHNALQEVQVRGASGGVYRFGFKGETTADIDYYDNTSNPHGIDSDITTALVGLPNVGPGNVFVHPAQLFPVWELTLTLNNGVNEIQWITFTGNPNGGKFKLGYGLEATAPLALGAAPSVVQTALEGLTAIGSGNVAVTALPNNGYQVEFKGTKTNTDMEQLVGYSFGFDLSEPTWFFGLTGGTWPAVQTATVVQGSAKFSEQLVSTLNKTVNDYFASQESLTGVRIDYAVHDNKNTTITATSIKAFTESDLITFQTGVTSDAIKGWLNNVSALFGLFSTIHVDFYWNHVYQVEFIGALGKQPQPALEPDISDLIGLNDEQTVEVRVIKPGKERFTKWPFIIAGSTATMKIESEVADEMPAQVHWQLVFLPNGEAAGGEAVARGTVAVQE